MGNSGMGNITYFAGRAPAPAPPRVWRDNQIAARIEGSSRQSMGLVDLTDDFNFKSRTALANSAGT